MQVLSDKIGQNQCAQITYECMDCGEEHIVTITRVSETEMEIDNAVIGVRKANEAFSDRYVFKCPACYTQDKNFGSDCDIYSRVVGFYRPTRDWNKGKQAEYDHRVVYDMPEEEIKE